MRPHTEWIRRRCELHVIEAARTKWPSIPDDVQINETTARQVDFPVLKEGWRHGLPWGPRRLNFREVSVVLEPVSCYWLGYNDQLNVLCVNFTGRPSAN